MNKKQLAEILKYSNPKEIYVITWDNQLIKLKCPFKVRVIQPVATLKLGQILQVEKVQTTKDLETIFMIKSQAYHYYYFDIVIDDN